jgi:hypothetical protein
VPIFRPSTGHILATSENISGMQEELLGGRSIGKAVAGLSGKKLGYQKEPLRGPHGIGLAHQTVY